MKSFLSLLLLFLSLFSLLSPLASVHAEENEDSYFVVTAYYSPLPDQKHYLTGNYEDEIVLNGQGIAGASGKKVFSGMLAAPGKYAFGTKIYLDGLGIGEVSDRGGAIVPAGQRGYAHDRIDIWMGYGDEGLQRALFWGKRKVYGYIVDSGNAPTLSFESIPSPTWASSNLSNETKEVTVVKNSIFDLALQKEASGENVTKLQNILLELEYLSGDSISGVYDSATIAAIYDFQVRSGILKSEQDIGAGVFGPKTRKELKKLYEAYQLQQQEKQDFETKMIPLKEKALEKAEKHITSLEKPLYGEISPRVRELQKTLSLLGYFPSKDTAIFGIKTQNALLSYQKDKELIQSENDAGAGTFGPQTRAQFTKDLSEIYFLQILEEEELTESYKKYYDEEHILSQEGQEDISLLDMSSRI